MPAPTPLDELVLVRLLPSARAPAADRIADDLAPLLADPPTPGEVRDRIDALRDAGDVHARRVALTDAGRARALRFLGLPELPPRWTWRTLRDRALPCRALGLDPTDPGSAEAVSGEDRLAARLLRRQLHLAGDGDDLDAVLQALVCRELGRPECDTFDALAAAVLSRTIGADAPLTWAQARTVVPRVLLGASGGAEGLREHAVRTWSPAPELVPAALEPAPAALPPADPAAAILAAARACPTGRFGRDKVLVHHVWAASRLADQPLDGFKALLVALNGAGRVALARADLVQLMDPDELARAEIRVGAATFHFVRAGAAP